MYSIISTSGFTLKPYHCLHINMHLFWSTRWKWWVSELVLHIKITSPEQMNKSEQKTLFSPNGDLLHLAIHPICLIRSVSGSNQCISCGFLPWAFSMDSRVRLMMIWYCALSPILNFGEIWNFIQVRCGLHFFFSVVSWCTSVLHYTHKCLNLLSHLAHIVQYYVAV